MPRKKVRRKHSVVEVIGLAAIGIFVVGVVWLAFFAPSQPQTPTTPNVSAPDFTLTDVDGNSFRLSDQQGKVVVLEFMRTTCSACVTENPHLRKLRSNVGGDVVMVTVSVDPAGDTNSILRDYRNQDLPGWIAIRDTAGVYQRYGVQVTPTIFIIDQSGEIRYQHAGVTESSVLIGEVESLAK